MSEAEVYDVAIAGDCAPPAETFEVVDAAEDVRVKGEGMAENRLVGLDAAAGFGSGAIGDGIGWIDVGWTEVGLPPGVRALFRVIPIAPDKDNVSVDCE